TLGLTFDTLIHRSVHKLRDTLRTTLSYHKSIALVTSCVTRYHTNGYNHQICEMPTKLSKPLSPGDVITQDIPIIHILFDKCKDKYCDNCFKRSDQLKRCAKCLRMYYCGKECQKNDWKYHKNECPLYRMDEAFLMTERNRFWFRLYLSVQLIPTFATKKYRLFDGSEVSLRDIKVRHREVNVDGLFDYIGFVSQGLRRLHLRNDRQEVRHWFAFVYTIPLIAIKSCDVPHVGDGAIGRGLYMQYTLLGHSCQPNSAFVFNDQTKSMELRAMRPIGAGEEITISYIQIYKTRARRQRELQWLTIVCECDKCVHHLDRRVDYRASKVKSFWPSREFSSAEEVMHCLRELMDELDVIFGDYHPQKTCLILGIVKKLLHCPERVVPETLFDEMKANLMKAIDVTFLADCPLRGQSPKTLTVDELTAIEKRLIEMSPKLSKPLSPGDVITEDMPIIHILYDKNKDKYCDNCLKRSDQLKRCSKCLRMYYCSKECQKNDWKYHKNECPLLNHESLQYFLSDDWMRFWFRLYLSVQNIPTFATEKHRLFDGSDVSLRDIKVNAINDDKKCRLLDMICDDLSELNIGCDRQELEHWMALLSTIPLIAIKSGDLYIRQEVDPIGAGLYAQYLLLGHSCQPNSAYLLVGKDLSIQLRAMRPIAVGEEITISFVNLCKSRDDRQKALKVFSIDCECDKCVHHLDRDLDYMNSKLIEFLPLDDFTSGTQLMHYLRQALSELHVIYGEYHPQKTFYMISILMKVINCSLIPDTLCDELKADLMKAIDVTYLADCPLSGQSWQTLTLDQLERKMSPKLSKPLSPGDVISEDLPLIHVLDVEFKGKYCDNCFKRSDQLKRCTKCLHMYYCDKECQKNDWKYHKNECPFYGQEVIQVLIEDYWMRFWFRLYISVKKIPTFATKKHRLFDGSEVSLRDIKVNTNRMTKDGINYYLSAMCLVLRQVGIDFTREEVNHWLAVVFTVIKDDIKAYDPQTGTVALIGRGLYVQHLLLKHSCRPNSSAIINLNGLSIQLRAMTAIAADEEITVSLVDLDLNRDDRHSALKQCSIVCECDKCVHHLDRRVDYQRMRTTDLFPLRVFTSGQQLTDYLRELLDELDLVFGQYYPKKTIILSTFVTQLYNCPVIPKCVLKELMVSLSKAIAVTQLEDCPLIDQSLKSLLSDQLSEQRIDE
ncbi:unnamed protein product, partial [Medioppia subpectinata]